MDFAAWQAIAALLAIIVSLVIIVGSNWKFTSGLKSDIISLDKRMSLMDSSLNKRIDDLRQVVDNRVGAVDNRISVLENSINKRIDDLNQTIDHRIDVVDQSINKRIDDLNQTIDNRIDVVDQSINKRIDDLHHTVDKRIDDLQYTSGNRLDEMSQQMTDMRAEIRELNQNFVQHLKEHKKQV